MREEINFNNGWSFVKLELGTDYNTAKTNSDFKPVCIPHDWLIYDTNDLYGDASGWYKKSFELKKESGFVYKIEFDGVYMDSTVYVNDTVVGTWEYGYSAFEYDITGALRDGENTVYVEVRHRSPNTRWYSGAGIFRDITFKKLPNDHIATNGIYISAQKAEHGRWYVRTETTVESSDEQELSLSYDIRLLPCDPSMTGTISKPVKGYEDFVIESAAHGDNCAVCEHPCSSRGAVRVTEVKENGFKSSFYIDNPFVWDLEIPNRYELTVNLVKDNCIIDTEKAIFGLRDIKFDCDNGFFLNGRKVKLYGVCEHHDLGCLGAAFNRSAMRRKFEILKRMGVNAVRTSHNMPAKGFMELADEMGIMVCSEAFDMWRRSKTTYDYARFFDACHEKDIESWIKRDRNHPSVIMWSIGNEIYDCHGDETAVELTSHLRECVEKWDYMHNATVTFGSNYMPWEGAQKCADRLKLVGYNYGEKCYDAHHEKYKDWMIYGSETSSTVQSRGIYHFPLKVSVMADDDEQCSVLGNCTTSWGAPSSEYVVKADRDHEFSMGQFIWSGFDYIGEPTPYHTKNSYFGQIDTAGFPKDTYYIYKAEWTDPKKAPFVNIFPYWDFNEGQLIDVRVASNLPKVELFVNGKSLGVTEIDHEHGDILCPSWQVPYESGELFAKGYDENGKLVAIDIRASFGDSDRIRVREQKFGFESQTAEEELVFLEIFTEDSNGEIVENSVSRVNVKVNGDCLLEGLDNGDSTDYEQYKCNSRRLFSGRLLCVLKKKSIKGKIDVEVTGPGLIGCRYTREYNDLKENAGIEFERDITELPRQAVTATDDIPVRKIEFVSEKGYDLRPDLKETTVSLKLHPENASYNDIEVMAVNDYAVKSNLSAVKYENGTAKVAALGDGSYRLRAFCRNGTNVAKTISSIEMTNEGFGCAYINPYEFVYGSLYTDSKGDIGNGNEKGVATGRLSDSYIGYENINFGDYGSDEITIPIFTLDSNPYEICIYEGRPGESENGLVFKGIYQKPSIWNVYQPETFKLNRRLKGVTSIYFTAKEKFHIKGFSFRKYEKAYEVLNALDNSRIYGDTFTVGTDAITEIGNNVTIEYDSMDFSEKAVKGIKLTGRALYGRNSINLLIKDKEESKVTLLEFDATEDYEEKYFDIPEINKNCTVALVFLPGCRFDLRSIQFV